MMKQTKPFEMTAICRAARAAALAMIILAGVSAEQAIAAEPTKGKAKALPACESMRGVEMKMCLECHELPTYRRPGCEQRVFWTTCKGKRLFTDEFCKMHQDSGPPQQVR